MGLAESGIWSNNHAVARDPEIVRNSARGWFKWFGTGCHFNRRGRESQDLAAISVGFRST